MNGAQISLILCLVAQFIDQACFRTGQMLLRLHPQRPGWGLAQGHFLQQTPKFPLLSSVFSFFLSLFPPHPTRTKRADAGSGPLTPTQTYGSDLLCLCNYTGACFSMAPSFIAQKPTNSNIKHFYGFSSRGSLARTCIKAPRTPDSCLGNVGTLKIPSPKLAGGRGRKAQVRCKDRNQILQ